MILLALAIGIILARTLLQHRRSRWQQSPYLLTANTPVKEDDVSTPASVPEEKTDKSESSQ